MGYLTLCHWYFTIVPSLPLPHHLTPSRDLSVSSVWKKA